jgi:hypothetical protein
MLRIDNHRVRTRHQWFRHIFGKLRKMLESKKVSLLVGEELTRIIRLRASRENPSAVGCHVPCRARLGLRTYWRKIHVLDPARTSADQHGDRLLSARFRPPPTLGVSIFMSGEHMGIGMDSASFLTLESAMRESMAWNDPKPENYEVP